MGRLISSSEKYGNIFMKAGIFGLCLLLLGVFPQVQGAEMLQSVADNRPTTTGAMVGWNLTSVGDVNGDGDEDYALGAPGVNKVHIFHGPVRNPLNVATSQWSITGPTGSRFGWDIQSAGDYNGDGKEDIIVGAPGEDKAYVFEGRSSGFPSSYNSADFTISGTAGDEFGHSVCGINLDGNDGNFVVVGAPNNVHYIESIDDSKEAGAVFLFNMTYFEEIEEYELDSDTNSSYIYKGDEDNYRFGFTVRNVGMVNTDMLSDLGISDPYYSPDEYTNKGAFYLHYGKNLLSEPPEKLSTNLDGIIIGPANNSKFGWSARGIGDIKGSGDGDFIVGAPFGGPSGEGEAYVIQGQTTAFSLDLGTTTTGYDVLNGSNPGDRFGMSFDLTMIDGPSVNILSIGAPGYDNGTLTDAGAVYSFWSWATIETANNANTRFWGDQAGENLGYSLCEVNYTFSSNPSGYLDGILAGSPLYGSGDNGRLQVLRRNTLPSLSAVNWDYSRGSMSKTFTISMAYTDRENDPPAMIKVDLYYDSNGDTLALSVPLQRRSSDTNPFNAGVVYEARTTLPSSIRPDSPDESLYLIGSARAKRGSMDVVTSIGGIVSAMIVDGVEPSAPDNLNEEKWTSLQESELIPGTFKIRFEWPEDNNGYENLKSQKVDKMEVRYLPGTQTIDASNWDTATIYKSYQASIEIKDPFATDSLHLGKEAAIFTPMKNYSVAMRAWDEVGNIGPVSATVTAEAYWIRPAIPEPVLSVSVSDYMGEDDTGDQGGKLKVTFVPSQITNPGDIGEYRVFVTKDKSNLGNVSDITWNPDRIITEDDEEGFYNYTFILDSYHDGDLLDGESYYVSVVPVNWLGQHAKGMTWSELPVKVINNILPAIPKIRDVDAISINSEGMIKVTWTPTTFDRFTKYEIYGQSYFFDNIEEAILLGEIEEIGTSEFTVSEISGDPIIQSNLYSFAVLVEDHNDHIDLTLDENNTVHGVKYVAPDPIAIPGQIKGVSMSDVPNDGGSALTISWFRSTAQEYWQYNIYLDDKEITDISGMEPIGTSSARAKTDMVISEFEGDPLVDGMMYYAAVTIVDWNLLENTLIDMNNTASAEPVNQSDYMAPTTIPANLRVEGDPENTEFTIMWDTITYQNEVDFNHYLVTYSGGSSGIEYIIIGEDMDDETERIALGSLTITGLTRGTTYYVNISVVDDAGNIGPSSSSLEVETGGANQPPMIIQIIMTINEDLVYLKNATDTAEVDLTTGFSIIYFQGEAEDDYTRASDLLFKWNITLPDGTSIEKTGYSFDLDLSDIGTYTLELIVEDRERFDSDPLTIEFQVKKDTDDTETNWLWIILGIVAAIVIGIAVIIFVVMSGNRSQRKQKFEEYKEKRNDIDTMEPIYTSLPTWTCDCGTTQVAINEHAYCNACYQSHEAVPIDGIDEYLHEHDLVLGEMKINVPAGWQGQDDAISRAKTDLEDRKKRATDSLNQEYAPVLQGTEYEEELKDLKPPEEEGGESVSSGRMPPGAIIPGQSPPAGPIVPGQAPAKGPIVPGQPGPIRPVVGGQAAGGPVRPPVVPQAGAPGQRPPVPQVGQQQRPPQPPQQ